MRTSPLPAVQLLYGTNLAAVLSENSALGAVNVEEVDFIEGDNVVPKKSMLPCGE